MFSVAAILALGSIPPAVAFGRGRRGGIVLALAICWTASLAVGWASTFVGGGDRVPEAGRPLEVSGAGYQGSGTCEACHPNEYATWYQSYHRTMTQLAEPHVVRGNFDDVDLTTPDGTYRLEQRDGAFFANGARVVMTTGSHTMQAYWTTDGSGRQVSLMQAVYLFDEERWIPRRDAFLQPPSGPERSDHWSSNCIICHSTDGRPRLAEQADTHVGEFGIACEACHGPAERHSAKFRSPLERYKSQFGAEEGDDTITDPRHLSARLASHICARCHANTAFTTPEDGKAYYEGDGDGYRPGDDLNRTAHVIRDRHDPYAPPDPFDNDAMMWPDGPSRGSGREFNAMLHSRCYGDGERSDNVSCLSCHRMHQPADDPRPTREWAEDQLGVGMDGDLACLQCHARIGNDITAHTRHPAESSGSRCYNCHMPYTTYGLLKAIRSHTIDSPDVTRNLATGRPNACNLCHLDKPLGYAAYHLQAWYGQPRPQLTVEQELEPAAALWLLTGDARQRALVAWHAGWEPAQQFGNEWIAPVLAPLLSDPYSVVRIVAGRALRRVPGFETFRYDDLAPRPQLEDASQRVWQQWYASPRAGDGAALPATPRLDPAWINSKLERRVETSVGVTE